MTESNRNLGERRAFQPFCLHGRAGSKSACVPVARERLTASPHQSRATLSLKLLRGPCTLPLATDGVELSSCIATLFQECRRGPDVRWTITRAISGTPRGFRWRMKKSAGRRHVLFQDVPARFEPFYEGLEVEVEKRRAADAERVELVRCTVVRCGREVRPSSLMTTGPSTRDRRTRSP
jgi:hypothetical protein